MLALFQQGIPAIFFPALEARGWRIVTFPTDVTAASAVFATDEAAQAQAIFFRANFALNKPLLDLLQKLEIAALVSTGSDNLDRDELHRRGIRFVSGEGANAQAVFDYVIQALCFGEFDFARDSLGVVGAGRIGRRVLKFLQSVGTRTAFYDPLLADPGSLAAVLECDVVTFHTDLTRTGEHATAAMLDDEYFSPVKKKLRIIQASRGGIWNAEFYRNLKKHPHLEILAQDVYPDEPPPAQDLGLAKFSTPHTAGYSTHGRLGGIVKGIKAILPDFDASPYLPHSSAWFLDEETALFAREPQRFHALRDNYFWRSEFWEYSEKDRNLYLQRFPRLAAEIAQQLFNFPQK